MEARGEGMRIKVTGYINTDSLGEGYLDPRHETGLTEQGFFALRESMQEFCTIDDLEFEAVP